MIQLLEEVLGENGAHIAVKVLPAAVYPAGVPPVGLPAYLPLAPRAGQRRLLPGEAAGGKGKIPSVDLRPVKKGPLFRGEEVRLLPGNPFQGRGRGGGLAAGGGHRPGQEISPTARLALLPKGGGKVEAGFRQVFDSAEGDGLRLPEVLVGGSQTGLKFLRGQGLCQRLILGLPAGGGLDHPFRIGPGFKDFGPFHPSFGEGTVVIIEALGATAGAFLRPGGAEQPALFGRESELQAGGEGSQPPDSIAGYAVGHRVGVVIIRIDQEYRPVHPRKAVRLEDRHLGQHHTAGYKGVQ